MKTVVRSLKKQIITRNNMTPFMAPMEKKCAVCGDTIEVGGYYFRVEPPSKKKESYIICLDCGKIQKGKSE